MEAESKNLLLTIFIPLLSAFLALLFGLSGFLSSMLGRVPAINRRRNTFHKVEGTKLWMVNNGTGPAVLTRLVVTYWDSENQIDLEQEIDGSGGWYQELWQKIIDAEKQKDVKRLALHSAPFDLHINVYYMNIALVAPADKVVVLELIHDSPRNQDAIAAFMKSLNLIVEYKSMNGLRYSSNLPYHPAGNLPERPLLFSFYLVVARILGIFRWD